MSSVVAGGHGLTVATAEDVLRAGGNAYDAAIAALATSFVAEPVLSSPGGGGFLLAVPAAERPRVYDAFVQTPRRRRPADDVEFRPVTADFGTAQQEFHIGRGTIATPGLMRGIAEIHADLATVPLRELVAPACRLAIDGVTVSEMQAYLLGVVKAILTANEACRSIFASIESPERLARAGERSVNPGLADALESMAIEGVDLFYRGEIAASLASDMAAGGHLAATDLAAYRVEKREPLSIEYRGARILTNPPPSSGGTLIGFGLDMLRAHDPGAGSFGSAAHLGLLAAVMEATSAARIEHSIAALASLDARSAARWREHVARRSRAFRGTTHVSVIDGAGNIASATVSNGEGSSYVIPGTGIVMNNMLGEEDLNPGRLPSMDARRAHDVDDGAHRTRLARRAPSRDRLRGLEPHPHRAAPGAGQPGGLRNGCRGGGRRAANPRGGRVPERRGGIRPRAHRARTRCLARPPVVGCAEHVLRWRPHRLLRAARRRGNRRSEAGRGVREGCLSVA